MEMPSNAKHDGACSVAQSATGVLEKARESATAVKDQALEAVSHAGKKADEVAASAGRGLEAMADGIRQHAPSNGIVGDASKQLVSTLQSSGRYLEEHGVTGMADEVTEIIRRNPIPAIFVALGLGFVLARATSVRS